MIMKIAGMCIVGSGEADRYLDKTLKEFKRLCDKVIIATNDATQKDKDLISSYGFEQYEDNREWGIHQPHIKADLLAKFIDYKPDWVVALDSDEQFCKEVTRETLEKLASTEEIGWYFMIVNLCGDKNHFAHGAGIKRFWNVRFFKFIEGDGMLYQIRRLHCGLSPTLQIKFGWYAPYYINHYGLMTEADRARKALRYDKYDPNARFIDKRYYDDLRAKLVKIPFNRSKLLAQLSSEDSCKPRITPKYNEKQKNQEQPRNAGNVIIKGNVIIL